MLPYRNSANILFSALLLCVFIFSSCAQIPDQQLFLNVEQIDRQTARSAFLETFTKYWAGREFGWRCHHIRRITGGKYEFVGEKHTSDNLSYIFLFDAKGGFVRTWGKILTGGKTEDLITYVLRFSPDSTAKFYRCANDHPTRFKFVVSKAFACVLHLDREPYVKGNRMSFSYSKDSKVLSGNCCAGYWPAAQSSMEQVYANFYFEDEELMRRFASVFMGAFPMIKLQ